MRDNRMTQAAKYYQVYNFMTSLLGLRGNERNVYAIIYGYSRRGPGGFCSSREYLANTASCSVMTVARALAKLVKNGHIEKTGTKPIFYRANMDELRELIDDTVLKRMGKFTKKSEMSDTDVAYHIETLSVTDCYRISNKLIHNNKNTNIVNSPSSSSTRGGKSVTGEKTQDPKTVTADPKNVPNASYKLVRLGHTKQLYMTTDQYVKLLDVFGEEMLERYIQKLEIDIALHGREPHSVFATILRWGAEDFGALSVKSDY